MKSNIALQVISIFILVSVSMILSGCASSPKDGGSSDSLQVASPDGRILVEFELTAGGSPHYSVSMDRTPVLQDSELGLVRADVDFSRGLQLKTVSTPERIRDRYEILTAKRRVNTYEANRKTFQLSNANGQFVEIVFQVSNDGVAFRYRFPGSSAETYRITEEISSFNFPEGARAWLQPMSVAKSGWEQTNPSYEEYYEKDIPVGTPSKFGAGWVYPALFRTGDVWVLISETGLGRDYCGTRLRSESPDGEYRIGFPDPREGIPGKAVNPESTLPWTTPWRVIAVGSLKTIAESMLGVDLATPPAKPADPSIQPGKASWSWPLLGDGQTVYDVQKQFIDYAFEMKWQYCLIDALWDQQIGYEKVEELVKYARGKNVRILLWYNSRGNWNNAPQTPLDRMVTHESRMAEFEKLKQMGVAGMKIDFFGGDGQSMMAYYQDIMEDAEPYGFLLNFHGCTLPRGWQRTYPHLMTMEAIRGLEFVTFAQANANQEPAHATMLPFTRNVFDPMDFTPMVLDRINRIQRRTTSAFELALSVMFTSGIQHYAEIPDGMAKAPDYVQEFLRYLPPVWDDVEFIDGFPGKYVVMARNGGGRWFLCGINGEDTARTVELDLSRYAGKDSVQLITDGGGGNLSFRQEQIDVKSKPKFKLTIQPRGGFVMVMD